VSSKIDLKQDGRIGHRWGKMFVGALSSLSSEKALAKNASYKPWGFFCMISFKKDIQPLFNEFDRSQMKFAFDLWDYEDVSEYAASILDRLVAGDMPCDAPWPSDQISLFRSWVDDGMLP
jgi:hypothetical protein